MLFKSVFEETEEALESRECNINALRATGQNAYFPLKIAAPSSGFALAEWDSGHHH